MIHRLVKLTFHPEHIAHFQAVFKSYKRAIRNSPGCQHLEAWQDLNNPAIFFTFSKWDRPEDLEAYRQSDTFKEVWPKTKILFSDKPEAWSTQQIDVAHES
ncbi:MAG: antibiotic biosynthesis monooxygenase [Saprospiraceae bacterium]|nr:antibiotic biosynthesis monooxygenase [Saprospiraceae bacterium]